MWFCVAAAEGPNICDERRATSAGFDVFARPELTHLFDAINLVTVRAAERSAAPLYGGSLSNHSAASIGHGGDAMHKRVITREQFDTTVAEMTDAQRQPGNFDMIVGRHEDHVRTVVLRVGGLILAFVEDAMFLDAVRSIEGTEIVDDDLVVPDAAILKQAMQARYLTV